MIFLFSGRIIVSIESSLVSLGTVIATYLLSVLNVQFSALCEETMKKYTRLLSWIIAAVLLLLSGFSAFPVFSQGSNQTLTQGFNGLESLQFGIVDEEKLWVAIGEALYLSKNQGQSWTNISPKQYLLGLKNYALFDNGTGTIISLESSVEDITTTLLKTNNFGMDWKEVQSNLSFVLSDSHAYPVESLSVQWLNERVGWLMAKQATGINFSVGYLFTPKMVVSIGPHYPVQRVSLLCLWMPKQVLCANTDWKTVFITPRMGARTGRIIKCQLNPYKMHDLK